MILIKTGIPAALHLCIKHLHMQTENNILVGELLAITESATAAAKTFRQLNETQLNLKEAPEKWSILECLEHLNLYGDFYLPEIQKAVLGTKRTSTSHIFRSGLIGNYFANLMKVRNGKIVKMKTFADKNPVGSQLTLLTIDRFLKQQEMLKSLLEQARTAELTHTKVPISLTKLIKLRLGDTLRFFVYHIERHIAQAAKIVDNGHNSH